MHCYTLDECPLLDSRMPSLAVVFLGRVIGSRNELRLVSLPTAMSLCVRRRYIYILHAICVRVLTDICSAEIRAESNPSKGNSVNDRRVSSIFSLGLSLEVALEPTTLRTWSKGRAFICRTLGHFLIYSFLSANK